MFAVDVYQDDSIDFIITGFDDYRDAGQFGEEAVQQIDEALSEAGAPHGPRDYRVHELEYVIASDDAPSPSEQLEEQIKNMVKFYSRPAGVAGAGKAPKSK